MNKCRYPGDDDGNLETTEVCTSPDPENNVMTVTGWWTWQHHSDRDENKGVMGTGSNEVQCQGNTRGHTCYRTTGVRSDMVMASRIDGPSHKWAVQSVTSHDPKIT